MWQRHSAGPTSSEAASAEIPALPPFWALEDLIAAGMTLADALETLAAERIVRATGRDESPGICGGQVAFRAAARHPSAAAGRRLAS